MTSPIRDRPLHVIAAEIRKDWSKRGKINYAAVPYLDAMSELNGIDDMYYMDSAKSIVRYFLSNARAWRGDVARRVKAELKGML